MSPKVSFIVEKVDKGIRVTGMVKALPPKQKTIIRCFVAGAEQSRLSPLKTHRSTFKLRYCG